MKNLSLRGTIALADNARLNDYQVFTYEAGDLTRAWIVKEFYLWPRDFRAQGTTSDGQFLVCASLATDVIGSTGFDEILNVDDNRQIGWLAKGYNLRNASSDFIAGPTGITPDNAALLDPDHVINNELFINLYTTSDDTNSATRRWNYLVILEPKKISPVEAILQLVKGKAQNIDS